LKLKQALILAGGLGKRLGEKSKDCPKPMQLINQEPFLNNIIWNLKRHDITDIILSIGYLPEKFKEYYGTGQNFEVKIRFVQEEKPAGTAGAIKLCESFLDDYFLLINGDTLFDINFHDLAVTFNNGKIGHLALNFVNDTSRYGEVKLSGKEIIEFKEKSQNNYGYINSGVAIFHKRLINFISNQDSSLEKDVYPKMINKKLLSAKKYKSFFLDIGIPVALSEAQSLIPKWRSKSALLLDRDGVINIDFGYVHSMNNFKWISGARETIKMANDLGILVIVITNQAGIARGLYSEKQFQLFSKEINNELKSFGAHIDATYFCPHHPTEGINKYKINCKCRKPKNGLIKKAILDWKLQKRKCFLIGDKKSDIIAAKRSGIESQQFFYKKDNLLEIFKNKLFFLTDNN
tara:strand:- start:1089 stop:2303 length:1215 start_codon:yes stop_codon:yes gene_type:complete